MNGPRIRKHPLYCHLLKARQVFKAHRARLSRISRSLRAVHARCLATECAKGKYYGKQMDRRWDDTNIEEMEQFSALCLFIDKKEATLTTTAHGSSMDPATGKFEAN
ncbi:hypothetical protein KIN20_020863, partial [Parelaphostrongylus tenuis]